MNHDAIIIGAGHNGLVAACYLAKAGLKTLVLERRKLVGGAAVTEEIHPGFRCSTLAHSAAPFFPQIVKDLQLTRHGLEIITPPVRVLALSTDAHSFGIYQDSEQTVRELEKFLRRTRKATRRSSEVLAVSAKCSLHSCQ